MKKYGKFSTGPAHIFNPVPQNEEEAHQHGNALAASGNYPVGTSNCFNVGISGGCGPKCFEYLAGECGEPDEMIECLDTKGLKLHRDLYPTTRSPKGEMIKESGLLEHETLTGVR